MSYGSLRAEIGRDSHSFPEFLVHQVLVIVRLLQEFGSFEEIRRIETTEVGVRDRNFTKPQLVRPLDCDSLAGDKAVIVVGRVFGVFTTIYTQAPVLKFKAFDRLGRKIELARRNRPTFLTVENFAPAYFAE